MSKKRLVKNFVFLFLLTCLFGMNVSAADYTQGVDVTGDAATIWFQSSVDTSWVDVHYQVNAGTQQNLRMTYNSGTGRYEQDVDLAEGDVLTYFFTYNNGSPAYDSSTYTYQINSDDNSDENTEDDNSGDSDDTANSIYEIEASSIPNPTDGSVSVKVMNGTSGTYSDDEIYWAVLGINPETGAWSYLDLEGNLIPISESLNDATGHLTKDGVNYANIYHKVSDAEWATIPQITSGRMFLSVGSPCYIKTYDDGFAGPNINNESDPNRDVYFDFVEFTVNDSGYHGNTTRVDQFGFPIQHRLVNQAGDYDRTVGELESETRDSIFSEFLNEVPEEFQSLATLQAPYRIVCPISGPFDTGGAYENYFSSYSDISTRDILLGINGASDPATCAALNRHVYTSSDWNDVSSYYQAAPANYYAKFWHDHGIDGLAYGFCYDDVNGQASYLEVGDPKGLIIRVGW